MDKQRSTAGVPTPRANEQESPKIAEMEEGKKLKVVRMIKLSMFTRKSNHLQTLLTGTTSSQKLHEAFEEFHKENLALETSQEDYMLVV